MKHVALPLLLLLPFGLKSIAQISAQHQARIKLIAKAMSNAEQKGDYNTVLAHTYPQIIIRMGGRENLLHTLTANYRRLILGGAIIKSVTSGNPKRMMTFGRRQFAVVPQTSVVKMAGGTLSAPSDMLAVSEDSGAHWYLVHLNMATPSMLDSLFPEIKGEIKAPSFKQPIIKALD
jgi:hypothetical protein